MGDLLGLRLSCAERCAAIIDHRAVEALLEIGAAHRFDKGAVPQVVHQSPRTGHHPNVQ
jgi:hypothetical protein